MLLVLTFVSSYLFGALNLIGSNSFILISKQTLTCIVLLTAVIIITRAPFSAYAVLFSTSLGGKFSRRFLAFAVLTVIFVIILEALLLSTAKYDTPDINAITVTADLLLLLFVIIMAGNKIEKQAEQLESLVLTDNLTSIYNLRGLNLHGEQKLLDARRNNTPLSVLVFDLDDLKVVNDQLGHEVGSKLIQSFAHVLNNNFRSNDIVARVGGDEFVVITPEKLTEVNKTLERFAQVVFEINKFTKQPYNISYSVGIAELQHSSTEDINDLINIADQKMYEVKKEKKEKKAAMDTQDYVI